MAPIRSAAETTTVVTRRGATKPCMASPKHCREKRRPESPWHSARCVPRADSSVAKVSVPSPKDEVLHSGLAMMRAVSMAVLQTRGREAAREVEDGREADPVLRFRNLRSAARTHRLVVVAEGHLDAAVERPVRVGAVGGDRRLFAVADRPMPTSALFTASARRSEGVAL